MAVFNVLSRVDEAPEQTAGLSERTIQTLLKLIRDNIHSQYGSQAPLLTAFRDAVATHGGTEDDTTLLADFLANVPLSDYDAYRPFVDKFNAQPCKEEDVENMFSPGLPDFFAVSSATSGTKPKIIPRYNHEERLKIPTSRMFDPDNKDPLAAVLCTRYRDLKVIERAPGEVIRKIPVCIATGGYVRRSFGWYSDDDHMTSKVSGYCVPWAATVIRHFPSLLIIHGLFFLAHSNVYHFHTPFATQFVDLIRHINEHWDMLVSCIRDGTIPDLDGIDDVREYLQAHFHPNPERAAELVEIGPPFAFEGWFSRVWPKAKGFLTICSGPFATVIPKVRSILGPNVTIACTGYGSSESSMGAPYDPNKLEEFIFGSSDVIEFLDVSLDASHRNLCQAWEVEVGRDYEPILTTRDGLWRYQLGDVLHIVGFDPASNSPLFQYMGRRWSTIRFPGRLTQITDEQLLAAIHIFSSEDAVLVQEFTTVHDDRALQPTVGFFIELAGPLGPNAHSARQKIFDALAVDNGEHQFGLQAGKICLPTIRIVKPGTFAEYRQWKGENANIASGQIKVPVILLNPAVHEWILERVIQEL